MRDARDAEAPPYLVAAVTGRMLAASAARGGHPTVVLDVFADLDTRALARRWRRVADGSGSRLDARALLAAARELAPPGDSAGLVYGSGLEGRPGLLRRLAAGRRLYGNTAPTLAAARDPRTVWPLLDRLGIPHPDVRLEAPADPRGWLEKRIGGAGGAGVRPAGGRRAARDAYWQRFERGRRHSALFLADGERALLLGVNQQWTAPVRRGRPFLYGGAVGGIVLPRAVEADLRSGLDALVEAIGLVGLNGIDFLLRGEAWRVLEVNPRPTATVELYDPDWPRGLFHRHLRACEGALPRKAAPPRAVRAHLVAYAAADARLPSGRAFPRWCRDLPPAGARFAPGDPVCTVHAAAADGAAAVGLLRRRLGRLCGALPLVTAPDVTPAPAAGARRRGR